MIITAARDLRWVNAGHTVFNAIVKLASKGEEEFPFTCTQNDVPWATVFWAEALAGKYGPIAEYEEPDANPV